ncbi:MAG: hypothetical protein WDA42_00880 [Candidatus Bathyarchaeia archaeon]
MGTRSHTTVKGRENNVYIYRQMDGYPTGHGAVLYEMLKGHRVLNGFTPNKDHSKNHNGLGCLFAYVVMKLKEKSGIGGIYLQAGKAIDPESWAEFFYTLGIDHTVGGGADVGNIAIKIQENDGAETVLYDGLLDEMGDWLKARQASGVY